MRDIAAMQTSTEPSLAARPSTNVFLDACSVGVPVVFACDPDDIIDRNGPGRQVAGAIEIINVIKELNADSETWNNMSGESLRYFRERHEVDKAMAAFADYFCGVMKIHYGEAK